MDHMRVLDRANELVAFEAFNLSGNGVRELVSKVLPNIVMSFRGFIGTVDPTDKPIQITSDQTTLCREISKHKYLDLEPLRINCPEGLNVPYLEYAVTLKAAVDHVLYVEDLLKKFTTFVGVLISNREQQLTTKTSVPEYLAVKSRREDVIERMAECFKNGNRNASGSYGDLVKRNSDWEMVLGYANQLAIDVNKVNRKNLNKAVDQLADLLDKVVALHKRGELDNVSPDVITELATGTNQIAKELEFFAVVYYRVTAYVEAVNSSAQYVVNVFKR